MKEYLKLTVYLRDNITHLFITTTQSYKIALQDTLAGWIKTALQSAGIDMNIFTTHSTRSALTSRGATRIPIYTVLKIGGCRTMRTFAKHNKDNKDNIFEENFANSVLNQIFFNFLFVSQNFIVTD